MKDRARQGVTFQAFHFGQFVIPVPFQGPGDQPIFGFNGKEPAAGHLRFITGAFQPALPLGLDLASPRFDLGQRSQGDFQLGWLHGLQEELADGGIHPIAAQCLTNRLSKQMIGSATVVNGGHPIRQIANCHPPATPTTQNDPLQQGRALSSRTALVFGVGGTVVVQAVLIAQKLLPGDIARMHFRQEEGPVLGLGEPAFDHPLA
jgi:hypothetical protein